MPLTKMEHFLVLTDDMEATREFYCDVLGMTVGARPPMAFPGYWIYLGDTPCIHVADRSAYTGYAESSGMPASRHRDDTGAVDHIAFNATDFDTILKRLQSRGMAFRENVIPEIGLRQLFVHDPSGVKIELNFRSA